MIEKNNYVKISVDMLGSETSIENIIKGLNNSFLRNDNYYFRLFGPSHEINNELNKYIELKQNTEIIDCNEMVEMTDKPSDVIKAKKNS